MEESPTTKVPEPWSNCLVWHTGSEPGGQLSVADLDTWTRKTRIVPQLLSSLDQQGTPPAEAGAALAKALNTMPGRPFGDWTFDILLAVAVDILKTREYDGTTTSYLSTAYFLSWFALRRPSDPPTEDDYGRWVARPEVSGTLLTGVRGRGEQPGVAGLEVAEAIDGTASQPVWKWTYRYLWVASSRNYNRAQKEAREKRERIRTTSISKASELSVEDIRLRAIQMGCEDSLRRCIWELPEDERRCIILRYWDDRLVREIAQALRCPENTVKSHLSRARKKLEKWLNEKERSEDGNTSS